MVRSYRTFTLATLAAVALSSISCGGRDRRIAEDDNAIAIGDSIMDWNRSTDKDIPGLVGGKLGLSLANAAVSGAVPIGEEPDSESTDIIPNQYESRPWKVAILEGGGNDIGDACNDVTPLVDEEAMTGTMVDLVELTVADGTEVIVLLGYYDLPDGTEFSPCDAEFATLEERYIKLADRFEQVIFVDPSDVVSPADLSDYDDDLVHPSPAGGEKIAVLIAEAVRRTTGGR